MDIQVNKDYTIELLCLTSWWDECRRQNNFASKIGGGFCIVFIYSTR